LTLHSVRGIFETYERVNLALLTALMSREMVLMTRIVELLADLAVEGDRLRAAIAGLPDAAWRRATPAIGWDVATQIAHLAWSDEVALLAVRAAA
jgi:hypothetical protein